MRAEKPRARGRPPLPATKRRIRDVGTTVTDAQLAAIWQAANGRPVAAWLYGVIVAELDRRFT